jgi:hypothetical protein
MIPAGTSFGPGRSPSGRVRSALVRAGVRTCKVTTVALGPILAVIGAVSADGATVSCLLLVTAGAGAAVYEREARHNSTPLTVAARDEIVVGVVRAAAAVLAVAGAVVVAGRWTDVVVAAAATAVIAFRWQASGLTAADGGGHIAEPPRFGHAARGS